MYIKVDKIIASIFAILLGLSGALILYLVTRIKNRSRDIIYIILLCIADMLPLLVLIIYSIMYLVNKDDPDNNLIAVQILGTLEMIWPFLTTILSSSLAIVRLTVTLNIKHPKYLILIPIACFLIYTSSYITLAVKTEIRLSPYGFLAHAYPNISSLSTFAFYCLPFCLIIGAILINYCYIKILYITRGSRDFNHFATFDSQLNKRATLFNQTNTSFRLWSIIFIHTITVFPAAIIFIIDGYYTANEPTTYSSAIVLGYFKVLLIVTASLSNSLFVLFNHPLIFTQLKTLCNID